MKFSTHPVCGCTDDAGKQLGQQCPKLHRATAPGIRATARWAGPRDPDHRGTKPVSVTATVSKAAEAAAEQVGQLLALAADDATRRKIGDLIAARPAAPRCPPWRTCGAGWASAWTPALPA